MFGDQWCDECGEYTSQTTAGCIKCGTINGVYRPSTTIEPETIKPIIYPPNMINGSFSLYEEDMIAEAVQHEREECARICERLGEQKCADAIRNRI